MPFNFDDTDPLEGHDTEEPPEQQADVSQDAPIPGTSLPLDFIPQSNVDVNQDETQYEQALAQVDRRMRVAQYFRIMLDHSFFAEDDQESRIAQARVRKFIRGELEVLFGMKEPAITTAPFTADEIATLKELVARLRKPTPPTPSHAPQLKPIQASRAITSPPAAAPKLLTSKPRPPPPQVQTTPTTKDSRIPEQHRDDPTARVINGHVYVQARDADGQLLWSQDTRTRKNRPVLKDVTPVARPIGPVQPLPMPSIAQQNTLSEQRASEQLAALDKWAQINPALRQIGGAVALSLLPGGEEK